MSVNSKMTAIANAVRDLRGMSGTMGLDAMATNISGAKTAVDAALAALTEKGVTVPDGTKVDGLAALIAAIEAGGGVDVSWFEGMEFDEGSVTYSTDTWPDNMILTKFNQCYGGIVIADSGDLSGSYVHLGVYVADPTRETRASVAGTQGHASYVTVTGMDGYYKANSFCLSANAKFKAGVTYKYVVWGA